MKIKTKYYIKIILLGLVTLFVKTELYSQGTYIRRSGESGLFIGISIVPSQSQILNDINISGSKISSSKMNSFSGYVDIGFLFSDYLGISSGIGLNSYKTQLSLDQYQNKFSTTDSENEVYELRISGIDIKETQTLNTLSIPICFVFRIPLNDRIGFFVQPGINLSLPLGKNYESSGTFTYKGYYITDNVLLENLPDFGFYSNLSSSSGGKLEIKSLVFNAISLAGIEYKIQEKIQISVGAYFNKTLSNISQYSSPDKFQLSTDPNQINSLMGRSTKSNASSIGLTVSFRYYLR